MRQEKKEYFASLLLKVPKEEADRIMKEKDVKLALDVAAVYEDAEGKIKQHLA